MRKRWEVASPAPVSYVEQFPGLSPFLLQILHNRGITAPEVEDFIAGRWPIADPFLLPDMDRAVDILIRAITNKVPIAVYGDYDTDGVTATALLVQALTGLGADVRAYIPNRHKEGYGLNLPALRTLYRQGVRLIVTVDCGTRAVKQIDEAKRGLEFVVTDHHAVGTPLPRASAVINPRRKDSAYPFPHLAGVGVALKLAQALVQEARHLNLLAHVEERSLLDLVAVGTVADLAPLRGENRALVRQGLEVLNEAGREGLRALLAVAGLCPGKVSTASISFGLAPRLNAAGRIDDASLSYGLLVTGDPAKARTLAIQLENKNRHRQALANQAYELAERMALADEGQAPILFAAHESFMSGIVGLVAGRLTETYYRPAVIVHKADELCKGSCRSIKEFHITRALDECGDLLIRHGGHAAAAGFTIRQEHLGELRRRLCAVAERELGELELVGTLDIDLDVPLSKLDWSVIEWLSKLEPCGEDNPVPLFRTRDVAVLERRTVGAQGQHLKLTVAAGTEEREAIAFHMGDRCPEVGERIDLVYAFEVNEWNGERRLQLNVQDLGPASGPNEAKAESGVGRQER